MSTEDNAILRAKIAELDPELAAILEESDAKERARDEEFRRNCPADGWHKVGHIDVDAGLCWIGDPCYVLHQIHGEGDQPDPRPQDIGKHWHDFSDRLSWKERYGIGRWMHDSGFEGLGVTVSTGGDGSFPVHVRYKSGRVMEVKVVFEAEECDDD